MTTSAEPNQIEPTHAWGELGLAPQILAEVEKAGFQSPTPVQSEAIPLALSGRDLIVSAQTGSGKTAAFVLPLIQKLMGRKGTLAIILAPSREIALQTQVVLERFGAPLGISSGSIIGGVDFKEDRALLDRYPHVLVATPGRLCDHLGRGNIWLDYTEVVILDEADRMLDMGFSDQLSRILSEVPKERQTMLFSATFPKPVEDLARKSLHDPARVRIGNPGRATKRVEQFFEAVSDSEKFSKFLRFLDQEPGSVFVFVRSKERARELWRKLHQRGFYGATTIHSNLRQQDREKALEDFKAGNVRVLIATDVVGRGIHVEGVSHVLNFDMPREVDDFIHRIGRTGRADKEGKATSFITSHDLKLVAPLSRALGIEIQLPEMRSQGSDSRDRRRGSRGGPSGSGSGSRNRNGSHRPRSGPPKPRG